MERLRLLFDRFDFESAHVDARVVACLVFIWLVILACAISSIRSQGFSEGQQRLWIAVVTLLPIVGLLAYLPLSVKHDDMPHYLRFRSKDRPRPSARTETKTVNRPGEIG
jgi:hypothetical protein